MKSKLLFIVFIGILLCGLISFVFIKKNSTIPEQPQLLQSNPVITVDNTLVVQEKLENIGELITQEYDYTLVREIEDQRTISALNIPVIGTKRHILYSCSGTLKVGINFSEIHTVLDHDTETITVSLPRPYIIANEPDLKTSVIYVNDAGIFAQRFNLQDYNDEYEKLKKDAEIRAVEKGVHQKAIDNAETIIENFIKGIDTKGYKIIFAESDKYD